MSATGKVLAEFAEKNSEMASSGLEAIERLARTANEIQSAAAKAMPFELVGDIIASAMSDMIPPEARFFLAIASFFTAIITGMISVLLARKLKESFFPVRESARDE